MWGLGQYSTPYDAARLLAIGSVYFVLAKCSLTLASLHPSASPVWPPSGIALAALLIWGAGVWPAIAAGAFCANALTFGSLASSVGIAAGNTLEAVVGWWLLSRWSGGTATFGTPLGVAKFATVAIAPGSMISALIGVGGLVMSGYAEPAKFTGISVTWWLGDVGGLVLVTPVLVLWAKDRVTRVRTIVLLGATALIGLIAFSPLIAQTAVRGALAFLAIGPLLWAALRHDQRDTASAALALSIFALWGTLANGGPFARDNLNDAFLLTLMFVISTAIPSLALSAEVAERGQSEERYRALVENANDIVATLDLDGRVTSVNPAVTRITGLAPDELIGKPLSEFIPAHELPMHEDMRRRKLGGDPSTRYEMTVLGKGGRRVILDVNSRLISGEDGKPLGIHSIARDVTDRKEWDARQLLLIGELQHRTKNMLAVIQSIATDTLRRSPDLVSAQETLVGRLHALGHAQDFVAAGPGGGAQIRELVAAELAPFAERARISGEPLLVGGTFAQTFALLTHELVTNSVKHGSLSVPAGRVTINWRIDAQAEDEACLHFTWRERGGPTVSQPNERGLGTALMTSIGRSELKFEPAGIEYDLFVPLSEVTQESIFDDAGHAGYSRIV